MCHGLYEELCKLCHWNLWTTLWSLPSEGFGNLFKHTVFLSRLGNLDVKWLEAEQSVLALPWSGGITGGDGEVQTAPAGLQSTKSRLGWIIHTHCGPQEGGHLGRPFSLLLPIPNPIHYQIPSIFCPKYFWNLGLLSKSIAHMLAKATTISHLHHGEKLCITLPLLSSPPVLQ